MGVAISTFHLRKYNKGFTLVELSIVIVIIAIIIAGVTAGTGIIQVAKLNGQIQQLSKFKSAYIAFKLQYDAIPGDFTKALSYWPGQTANGNGNNIINDSDGSGSIYGNADTTGKMNGEKLEFFRQLGLARVIDETYNGGYNVGTGYPKLVYDGKNGMAAGAYWSNDASGMTNAVTSATKIGGSFVYLGLTYCQLLQSSSGSSPWAKTNCSIFVPTDLQAIDTKLDDGKYNTGKFFGFGANCGGCSTCIANGNYNGNISTKQCLAMYRIN